jgi:ankyrin repeat protein
MPLMLAVTNEKEAVVNLLLAEGVDADHRDKYGRTPLLRAAENGHEAVVRLLLAEGVDAESKDATDRTPLSRAAEYGREAVVELLLAEGADANSRDKCICIQSNHPSGGEGLFAFWRRRVILSCFRAPLTTA